MVGNRLSVFENPSFVPTQVHQVGRVFAIVDGERRVKTDLIGIIAEETCADAVERAGPGQRIGHDASIVAHDLARDALDAARHLGGGAARKRHQQDPAGIGTIDDDVGDPVREGVRLSGSCASDDQKR